MNWLDTDDFKTTKKGTIPDSKVHGANMGPTWVLSAPDGPHVGSMNLAIRDVIKIIVPIPLLYVLLEPCYAGYVSRHTDF